MEPLPPPSIALVGSTESKRADKKGNFRFAASRANCIFNHVRVSPDRRSPLLSQRLWTIARAFSCGFRFRWSSWMLPAVRCVAGAPCGAPSGARLLAMFIGYPWYVLQYLHAMPPRHAAMRTPQRTCTLLGPCGLVGRGPLEEARSLSRAPRLNHPRATAPSRQGQGVGVARGVEGVSVCGLIWFDGMRALGRARRVSGAAVCRLFSAAPAPVGRYLLITLCD